MLRTIFILILVIVAIIVITPLMYFVFGKIKFDNMSPAKAKVALIGQNYIPSPGLDTDPEDAADISGNSFNKEVEATCSKEIQVATKKDIVSHFVLPANMQYIESKEYNIAWYLGGTWKESKQPSDITGAFPISITGGFDKVQGASSSTNSVAATISGSVSSKKSDSKNVYAYMRMARATSTTCVTYYNLVYGAMHDSGRFITEMGSKVGLNDSLSILEKGVITINGQQYYWYAFNSAQLLYNDSDQKYIVIFNTYKNGIEYNIGFLGTKALNGSYRKVFSLGSEYVAGLRI